tara:strand:+ start:736 stop:921 length:186 start_codon:yes stop_codon:yes gene_type:complete
MNEDNIRRLVNIRSYLIQEYKKLDGGQNPATSMMRQVEAASVYERAIRDLDNLLSEHVNFE